MRWAEVTAAAAARERGWSSERLTVLVLLPSLPLPPPPLLRERVCGWRVARDSTRHTVYSAGEKSEREKEAQDERRRKTRRRCLDPRSCCCCCCTAFPRTRDREQATRISLTDSLPSLSSSSVPSSSATSIGLQHRQKSRCSSEPCILRRSSTRPVPPRTPAWTTSAAVIRLLSDRRPRRRRRRSRSRVRSCSPALIRSPVAQPRRRQPVPRSQSSPEQHAGATAARRAGPRLRRHLMPTKGASDLLPRARL